MNNFVSSRDISIKVDSKDAVILGLAKDGGLFTPKEIKGKLDLANMLNLSYRELALKILKAIFSDMEESDLKEIVDNAYKNTFDTEEITPVKKVGEDFFLELWHGPTCAFKDVALTLLPHLMTKCYNLKGVDKKIVILTATSGDTGKAALEGFKDVDNIYIKVLYPHKLVSLTQERQMVTTTGKNTEVLSVKGNFDDCQRIVKNILENQKEYTNIQLSSANSINIGRLVPQVVYYFKAYIDLVNRKEIELGDKVDFIVPTGNFGDILAGYFGKELGLPVGKLVCASNVNNVLTDFINTGVYDSNRTFHNTTSPSIDILVSSNLERLLYMISKDASLVAKYMKELKENKKYTVSEYILEKVKESFLGYYANEDEVSAVTKEVFDKYSYLIDPHTAVAYSVCKKYESENKKVVLSTASPYKFSKAVYKSISGIDIPDDLNCIETLYEYSKVDVPKPLRNLKDLEVRFKEVIEKDLAEEEILKKLDKLGE